MKREDLNAALRELHQALASADSTDPETRQLLATVRSDLEQLDADAEGDDSNGGHQSIVADRLEDLAARFESDHPTLSLALRQLVDTLSGMGI